MPTEHIGRRELRTEAQPLDLTRLNLQQRRALEDVVGLIQQAANELGESDPSRPEGHGPALDDRRRNLTALIEGGRGSGKTSLLLTLLRELNRNGTRHSNGDILAGALHELQDRVVVLDPLDLEQNPAASNLLVALLVRLEDAMRRELGEAWLGFGEPNWDTCAASKLQFLTSQAAVAWDPKLEPDPKGTDVDARADAILTIERYRIGFNQQFRSVLADLARACSKHSGRADPLFLLPVDDLDLDPHRAPEMLRLLRLVAAPRLFVVTLADIGLLRFELERDVRCRWWTACAGTSHGTASDSIPPMPSDSELRGLANQILDKLIPPAQRISISDAVPLEVLAFRPLETAADAPTVSALLVALDVGLRLSGPAAANPTAVAGDPSDAFGKSDLGLLLLGPGRTANPGERARLLLRPMRAVVDLYHRLRGDNEAAADPADQIASLLRDVLDRPGSRTEGLLRRTNNGVWDVDLSSVRFRARTDQVVPNLVVADNAASSSRTARPAGVAFADGPGCQVTSLALRSFAGWDVRTAEPNGDLDPATAAALVVARDLVAFAPRWRRRGAAPSFPLAEYAHTVWTVTTSPDPSDASTMQVASRWPSFLWFSPLRMELCMGIWTLVVEHVGSELASRAALGGDDRTERSGGAIHPAPDLALQAAFGWVAAGVAALMPQEYDTIADELATGWHDAARQGTGTGTAKPNWSWLRSQIDELANDYRTVPSVAGDDPAGRFRSNWRTEAFRWLALLVAFLAPETGVPTRIATELLDPSSPAPDEETQRSHADERPGGLAGVLPELAEEVRRYRAFNIADLHLQVQAVAGDARANEISGWLGCSWFAEPPVGHPVNDWPPTGARSLCPGVPERDWFEQAVAARRTSMAEATASRRGADVHDPVAGRAEGTP